MRNTGRTWYATAGLLLLGLSSAELAKADLFVVAPNAQATIEGNSNSQIPFNDASSRRYQEVFGASAFGAVGGQMWITQILFRPDATFGAAFSSILPDIQVDLSTTLVGPDALSANFASNVGADDTVVYGRGALALSSAKTGPSGGPKDFDIVIGFTTPFLYDPAAGNLLLDVRNFGGGTSTLFDAQFSTGDSVSRAHSVFGEVGSGTASVVDTRGLVAEFRVAPVPEPSAWLLLATSLALSIGVPRRRLAAR